MTNQGYIGVADENVIYPAVAALANGKGAMVYTLAGQAHYPTAAYSLVGPTGRDRRGAHRRGSGSARRTGSPSTRRSHRPGHRAAAALG